MPERIYNQNVGMIALMLLRLGYDIYAEQDAISRYDGYRVSKDGYTVHCVVGLSPDNDSDIDFFVASNDRNTDGHIVSFYTLCADEYEYEIKCALERAFEDERKYRKEQEAA